MWRLFEYLCSANESGPDAEVKSVSYIRFTDTLKGFAQTPEEWGIRLQPLSPGALKVLTQNPKLEARLANTPNLSSEQAFLDEAIRVGQEFFKCK